MRRSLFSCWPSVLQTFRRPISCNQKACQVFCSLSCLVIITRFPRVQQRGRASAGKQHTIGTIMHRLRNTRMTHDRKSSQGGFSSAQEGFKCHCLPHFQGFLNDLQSYTHQRLLAQPLRNIYQVQFSSHHNAFPFPPEVLKPEPQGLRRQHSSSNA